MARLPLVPIEAFTPELALAVQRGLGSRMLSSTVPVQVWAHRPHAALAWLALLEQLHTDGLLEERLRELVRLRIAPYRGRLFERPGRLVRSQAEHVAVIEAIRAGRPDAAAEAMREHISAGGKAFADMVLSAPARSHDYGRQRRK